MKCIMHKSLRLKNSKLEKLFEVSVIYSVNSLCFYQHSAQRTVEIEIQPRSPPSQYLHTSL